jgi:tetratricopeptide (TPR) repeat protein
MGRTNEAVHEYRQTIRHSRGYVKAYYNLGNCHLKQGDYLDAIHCYRMVLRLDRTYDKAYFALGQGYLRAGNLRRARTAFASALRLRPDRHACRLQLAHVLVRLDRKTEAILHYRVFLRDAPEGPDHAEVHRRLQEFRRARVVSSTTLAAAS